MLEKLSRRDRIAVLAGAVAVALFLILNFGVLPALGPLKVSDEEVEKKELALRRDQRLLANAEMENRQLGAAQDRLNALEAGLVESPSPSLANAEWQRLIGQLAEARGITLGSSEFLRLQTLSPEYAMVTGQVQFRCRLDQLVDFLVAAATAPKLLSISRLTINASTGDPEGRLTVQLVVGAAVRAPKPEKSAGGKAGF